MTKRKEGVKKKLHYANEQNLTEVVAIGVLALWSELTISGASGSHGHDALAQNLLRPVG